jgi:hypothetical protein
MGPKNSTRDSYLVVGVLGKDAMYVQNRNEFGSIFRSAAEKVQASIKHDGFESSLIEIGIEKFEDFMDEL